MKFQVPYAVKSGDNLWRIGRKWRYSNPGPIFAYPGNNRFFAKRSTDELRRGDKILIPYPPDALKRIVSTSTKLAKEIPASAKKLIRDQRASQEELEALLTKVDLANFLIGMHVSIGSLAAKGAKGAGMTSKEALIWLLESRADIASNITTLSVPAPQAPHKGLAFFVRHTLGPWNPSFWASVVTAIRHRDLDLYLYGPAIVTHRLAVKIKRQADADVKRMLERAEAAQKQLDMRFYKRRV